MDETNESNKNILNELKIIFQDEQMNENMNIVIRDIDITIENSTKILKLVLDKKFTPLIIHIVAHESMGDKHVQLIKNYLNEYPLLKPIVIVLKQIMYLSQLTSHFYVHSLGRHFFVLSVFNCRGVFPNEDFFQGKPNQR